MSLPTAGPGAATRLFGVLGHPVSHSLSPALHNAAFRRLGLDACYHAFDVLPEDLADALAGASALGVGGLSVTVPHKEAALRLAAEADPLAALVGAANTLVPAGRGWKAFNTDVDGLLRALEADLGFASRNRRAVILGAGGAARAAAVGLLRAGIQEIVVVNRNRGRAGRLASELSAHFGDGRLRAADLDAQPPCALAPGDLLLSATPLGLDPQGRGCWPWDLGALGRGYVVYDMAYRAGETPLVEAARGAGLRAESGRRMLLFQGAAAFTLWTGEPAPVEAMARALAEEE